MYTIHVDGKLLYSTASEDIASIVLNPKLVLDVNNAGSLSFVLPPGNALHDSIQKLKSIVTVEQDGEVIFRGRVLDDEKDSFNQKSVYCEGDRSFLLDSVYAPYSYTGNIRTFFNNLISNHNSMVETNRRFTVGNVTAVGSSATMEVENDSYSSTSSVIEEKLLGAYGGYLRTRTSGNTNYIDWVKDYGSNNSQAIEFGVNLLDLKDRVDAGDVFTVLIPLGAAEIDDDGEYGDPLTVESVNGGQNYIQDNAAVAMYGKIWRTQTWSYEDNASELLAKGREYLKTGVALRTITLKAVDMHFVDGNVKRIAIGDNVHIVSNPNGMDLTMICSKMEIDLPNPENTLYTFGEAPRTLTENFIQTEEEVDSMTGYRGGGGGRKAVKDEVTDIIRWAKINVDENNANIQLTAGELDKTNKRLSAAEIEIDGLNSEVTIAASRLDDVEHRTTSTEIALDGANAAIKLKASQTEVDELGERVSQAEIDIDGAQSQITLKANKTVVDGILSTGLAGVSVLSANNVSANKGNFDSLSINGDSVVSHSVTVLKSASLSTTKIAFTDYYGDQYTGIGSVSLSTKTETIVYLST